MERVLPSPEVKDRLKDLAVGLAADCDAPEHDVERIMHDNLKGASTLPFVGFVTYDGKWVGGYSGFRDSPEFLKALEEAEQSPLIQATDAVRKKLAALVERAEKAAEKGDWKGVMAAARDAAKLKGRCPERSTLAATTKKARDWATARFDEAVKAARAGDITTAQQTVGDVRKQFAGEPEAEEADLGTKALRRLSLIPAGDAGARSREKATEEYKDTRWSTIFTPSEEAPAGDPPAEEPPEEGSIAEGC